MSLRNLFFCFIIFYSHTVYAQIDYQKCMRLDSALAYLVEHSEQSLSYNTAELDDFGQVCFNSTSTLRRQLDQIARSTNLSYKSIGNGYSITLTAKMDVYGRVIDADTGNPLTGVAVYIPSIAKGMYTDDEGYYQISVDRQSGLQMHVSYLGYEKTNREILSSSHVTINFELTPGNNLPEILIDQDNNVPDILFKGDHSSRIALHKLYHLPSFAGTSDIMRSLSTDSGISLGADAVSQLRVRGGNVDQNLILLDGVPIYHPTHSLGFTSIFNTAIVKEANFYRDNFDSRFAGRLSSVLDVETKNGNLHSWHGQMNFGLLGASVELDGPIIKDKATLVVQARKSIGTHFLDASDVKGVKNDVSSDSTRVFNNLHFHEFFAKLHMHLSAQSDVQIGIYAGSDRYKFERRNDFVDFDQYFQEDRNGSNVENNWGNKIGYINYKLTLSDRFQMFAKAYHSRYNYELESVTYQSPFFVDPINYYEDPIQYISLSRFRSGFNQTGLHFGGKWNQSTKSYVRGELQILRHDYMPGEVGYQERDYQSDLNVDPLLLDAGSLIVDTFKQQIHLFSAHLTYLLEINDRWSLRLGQVLSSSYLGRTIGPEEEVNDRNFWRLEPRFSVRYKPCEQIHLRLSIDRMVQYLHALEPSQSGLANRLAVPVQDRFGPETSDQIAWTIFLQSVRGMDWKMSTYYKRQKNIIRFKFDAPVATSGNRFNNVDAFYWRDEVTIGSRDHWGVELNLSKKIRHLLYSVTYNYGSSSQRYVEYIDGQPHPNAAHRDHQVVLSILYTVGGAWSFNVNWQYGSPSNLTLPAGVYRIVNTADQTFETFDMNNIFSRRLPAYHRMDIAINFFKTGPNLVHRFKAGLFNAYGRQNFAYYSILGFNLDNLGHPQEFDVSEQYGPQWIPSLQYSISF